MTWKRLLAPPTLVLACVVIASAVRADDPDNPPTPPPPQSPETGAEPAAPPSEAKKPGFWGDHFALYIEAAAGTSSADDIDSSIRTSSSNISQNTLKLDDNLYGRAAVGWTLPYGRGSFLLVFTGHKEDSYSFDARGNRGLFSTSDPFICGSPEDAPCLSQSGDLLTWWNVHVSGGSLVSSGIVPSWDFAADLNHDGRVTANEVVYGPPRIVITRGAPDNLQNRLQTTDLIFQRDFGGRRVSGRWSAGGRYFVYEGTILAGAWLYTGQEDGGPGYTDGELRPLTFLQDSSGIGPTASLEIQVHLFRKRLTFYGQGRAALIVQSTKADSGAFLTPARAPIDGSYFLAEARLRSSIDKTVWQVGAEIGARIRLQEGLHVEVALARTSYQDSLLLPANITVPEVVNQADQGTTGLFSTEDLLIDSLRFGLGFQF